MRPHRSTMTGGRDSLGRRAFLGTVGAAVLSGCSVARRESTTVDTDEPGSVSSTRTEESRETKTRSPETQAGTRTAGTVNQGIDVESSWSRFAYDTGNTGFNPDAAGPGGDIRSAWRAPYEGTNFPRSPVVVDGTAYVQAGGYAFDIRSGSSRWETELGAATFRSAPAMVDRTVFSAVHDFEASEMPGTLFALDAADGSVGWTLSLPEITGHPMVVDGTVYLWTQTADEVPAIFAVDGDEGDVRWSRSFEDAHIERMAFTAPLAVTDDAVHVSMRSSDGSRLHAVDRTDGSDRWQVSFDIPVTSGVTVSDEVTRGPV